MTNLPIRAAVYHEGNNSIEKEFTNPFNKIVENFPV
jgi:hypothetical protein